jgi:adenylate cyclase
VAPSQLILWDGQRDAQGRLPAQATEQLKDAIVVWGVNLSGQKDIVTTPISGRFRGPEFQATVVDNLLNGGGRLLVPCAWRAALLLLVLVGVGAWAPATHRRLAPHLIVFAAALFVGAVGVAGFAAGWVFDLATPWLGLLFTAAAAFTLRWATEGRYNRWLESAFGRYLSPSVIGALKSDPGLLALGGRRREVTILFSDVAGFTQASRRLTPEQLVQLLNEYLQMHGQAVFDHDGLIDKFIGDAVMAIYGDPVPFPDHAVKACRSALAVQEGLPALEPLWRSLGLDAFKVRVGLNSGPASVGNMGSRDRLSYTAMGDTVNLASRLEGANKVFGTRILIGPQTWEQARDAMLCRPLGRVQVVGYDAPVPVHELVASLDRATDEQKAHVAAFVRAQDAARAGDRAAALAALDECDRIVPGSGPVAWFRSLVSRLEGPWSGDLTLDAK